MAGVFNKKDHMPQSKDTLELNVISAIESANNGTTTFQSSYIHNNTYHHSTTYNPGGLEAWKYITKNTELSKFERVDYVAGLKVWDKTFTIGRTQKHVTDMQRTIRDAITYGGSYQSLKTDLPLEENLTACVLYPTKEAWPTDLVEAIKRYHQHYENGFIVLVGNALSNIYREYYGKEFYELSKTYNFFPMITWERSGLKHNYWYKIIPRECFDSNLECKYSLRVERIPRYWTVRLQMTKTLTITKKQEIKAIGDPIGLGVQYPIERWKGISI